MLLAALTLASLLDRCAPNVGRRTMTAIVRVESGGNPLLIRDNTLDRTFAPHDANQGVVWARQLLTLRHSIDLGISQINDANLPKLGFSLREAFDPCINVRGGATILTSDYRAAAAEFGQGQYALRRAIGAYNSGSLYAGYGYIAKILAAAGIAAEDEFRVPDLQAVAFPAPSRRSAMPAAAFARRLGARPPVARPLALDPFSAPILVAPDGAAHATASASPANGAPAAAAKARVDPAHSAIAVPIAPGAPVAVATPTPTPSSTARAAAQPQQAAQTAQPARVPASPDATASAR